jgi:hypothetical protein
MPTYEVEVTVKLGSGIVEVLQLDDERVRAELGGFEVTQAGRRYVLVTGEPAALLSLAGALEARCGPGWDQPAWYARSARFAANTIRRTVEFKTGETTP